MISPTWENLSQKSIEKWERDRDTTSQEPLWRRRRELHESLPETLPEPTWLTHQLTIGGSWQPSFVAMATNSSLHPSPSNRSPILISPAKIQDYFKSSRPFFLFVCDCLLQNSADVFDHLRPRGVRIRVDKWNSFGYWKGITKF